MFQDLLSDLSVVPPWAWLCLFLVSLALTLAAYIIYSGLFASIEVSSREPCYGDLTMAYKTGRGPYKNVGAIFTETYSLFPSNRCLGIYYDDPDGGTPAADLRYAVGTILAEGDVVPDAADMQAAMDNGFKVARLPRPNFAVVAEFPFRTTLSIYLSIWRVYPKLKEYISGKGLCAYPAVEIYEKGHIYFMMPLSRQEEWFVPEFSEEEVSIATTEMSTDSGVHRELKKQQIRKGKEDKGKKEQDSNKKAEVMKSTAEKTLGQSQGSEALLKEDLAKPTKGQIADDSSAEEDKSDSTAASEFEDLSKEVLEETKKDA